ncbi:unnamed protein product (macronuclear) [Paramecium tetraurelia]|uniref:BZIP domain-containing protein n=1 Tax=Paramecium tetraurelia TaxID=5888 RepID=A0EF62_PARTE|nr:uncharacterized protein GSPATT00026276001 [Paramecium tetraurelia]CAK93953.1 unnamed protein product [Paramecium tetraurelia]|eukprot:XP_001461326.1 hypothetical protein (macronuclear) [Paramecium tetraurelia strain d4-2]
MIGNQLGVNDSDNQNSIRSKCSSRKKERIRIYQRRKKQINNKAKQKNQREQKLRLQKQRQKKQRSRSKKKQLKNRKINKIKYYREDKYQKTSEFVVENRVLIDYGQGLKILKEKKNQREKRERDSEKELRLSQKQQEKEKDSQVKKILKEKKFFLTTIIPLL